MIKQNIKDIKIFIKNKSCFFFITFITFIAFNI